MGTQEGQLMVFGHGQEKLREMVLPASDERVRERERSGGHYAYRTLAHLSWTKLISIVASLTTNQLCDCVVRIKTHKLAGCM